MSQNVDNFISERSSTRRHAPPGGQSQISFIFGGGEEQPAAPVRRTGRAPVQQPKSELQQQADIAQAQANRARPLSEMMSNSNNNARFEQQEPAQVQKPVQQAMQGRGTSANTFATGSNQNCGNFLTDRPTSRVAQPPGGASNFTLG